MPDTAATPVVGQSLPRVGAVERVTGAQRYAADLRLEHALQVKLVHLDCARARILSVDRRRAAAIPGVRCIMTADDLPQPVARYGPNYSDRPILAVGETKFFGEPVVAIAAETDDAANAAAATIGIEYEELRPVLTIDQARDPASPLVQDPEIRPNDPLARTNTLKEWHFGWGNVEQAEAACVIDQVYTFPMVTHFAIEPHAFLAAPDQHGVTIWSPVQHPYILQRVVAAALGWPISKVRIIAPDPGGGFGGKGWPKVEPLMACLALRTGRPVRLVLTLEETFQAVRRASARVHSRTGFDRDGRIVFQDIETDFLLGAYADVGARIASKASYVACGPYRVPNARIVSRALLSHTTPSTAFRGFGTPQASWAFESQLNEAAAELGIDRVEIRRRNLPARGEAFVPTDTPADGDWRQALEAAASRIGWGQPLPRHRGRGVSLGLKSSATTAASSAIVRLHGDGSVSLLSGTSDMGQGARTIFTQIVADELGVAPDHITVIMGDTAVVPFDTSTSASRSTVFMGNAIVKACRHVKAQLQDMVGEVFPADRGVAVEAGGIRLGEERLSYGEFLQQYWGQPRGEVVGLGSVRARQYPEHPLGGSAAFWEFMGAAAEVDVDVETGTVQILRLVLVSDVGKALNPQQVESQDEGAAVMGLGHTLMEHLLLDDRGRIRNLGALDYRIPTIQDISLSLESVLIENQDGPGPYGAKGAGEGGILAIAAAVGSAIAEATGVIIRDLPLTPERIWTALQSHASGTKPGPPQRPVDQ